MMWPTLCVDNFLDNPDDVVDEALKGTYQLDDEGRSPGKRCFNLINLNRHLTKKIVNCIFPHEAQDNDFNAKVSTSFQLIDSSYNGKGWVHNDAGHEMTALIYLSKNLTQCGTSLYKPKNFASKIEDVKIKKDFYLGKNPKGYQEALEKNHSNFVETAYFDSIYNRLIVFDSSHMHGVKNFNISKENPRLTFICFFNQFFGPSLKSGIVQSKRSI